MLFASTMDMPVLNDIRSNSLEDTEATCATDLLTSISTACDHSNTSTHVDSLSCLISQDPLQLLQSTVILRKEKGALIFLAPS